MANIKKYLNQSMAESAAAVAAAATIGAILTEPNNRGYKMLKKPS